MAAAQRWVRKRGWAAFFQGAEVVGQHTAAHRGGVAIAGEEIAAPASGQVCAWLSSIVLSRFSQDSHLDPRTFRGHSLQLGRVFDSGGRALDHAVIFCAKWSGVLGTCGRAVPQPQRNSLRADLAAAQIEVGAVSKLTLPWLDLWWRKWNLARRVWADTSEGQTHLGSNVLPRRQRCWHPGTRVGRACWRRTGSTISW